MTKEADPMEAAVIASLVQSGVPYADARNQVLNGVEATPSAPLVDPEPEPVVVPKKSKDFSDEQLKLYNEVEAILAGEGQGTYEVTIELPEYLFDWVARRTIQEAGKRNDPSFIINKFMNWMIKQERAIDPSKGGIVKGGTSGPADSYNPNTERWN